MDDFNNSPMDENTENTYSGDSFSSDVNDSVGNDNQSSYTGSDFNSSADFNSQSVAYCAPTPTPTTGTGGKSKITAGLLGIFLGAWGVHRFYLGYTTMGIIQIVVTFLTCGLGSLWGFIEGILILCGSTITTDANGNPLEN